jgi:hypothetical protein
MKNNSASGSVTGTSPGITFPNNTNNNMTNFNSISNNNNPSIPNNKIHYKPLTFIPKKKLNTKNSRSSSITESFDNSNDHMSILNNNCNISNNNCSIPMKSTRVPNHTQVNTQNNTNTTTNYILDTESNANTTPIRYIPTPQGANSNSVTSFNVVRNKNTKQGYISEGKVKELGNENEKIAANNEVLYGDNIGKSYLQHYENNNEFVRGKQGKIIINLTEYIK